MEDVDGRVAVLEDVADDACGVRRRLKGFAGDIVETFDVFDGEGELFVAAQGDEEARGGVVVCLRDDVVGFFLRQQEKRIEDGSHPTTDADDADDRRGRAGKRRRPERFGHAVALFGEDGEETFARAHQQQVARRVLRRARLAVRGRRCFGVVRVVGLFHRRRRGSTAGKSAGGRRGF